MSARKARRIEGRWTTLRADLGVDVEQEATAAGVGGGEGGTSPPEDAEGVQGEEGSAILTHIPELRLILQVKSGSELSKRCRTWTRRREAREGSRRWPVSKARMKILR
mmetsp:Transcript_19496/g.45731  ORF Transcript_19496/g.45731 Transcript_19496/m.45731 type:complete len:108 (-) Transcript_19496:1163-1486(-)